MVSSFYPHLFWRADSKDYNCSGRTQEEWKQTGEVSAILGAYFFSVGVITLILYVFVIYTMSCRFLLNKACWKLMYFNCYVDCGNILVSCIFTGILFFDGAVFCTCPTIAYAGGGLGLGCWCASCVNCIAIAINRCCTMFNKGTGMFEGKKTYWWIAASVFLMVYSMVFSRPPIFNSKMGAWFYYPFILSPEEESETIVNYLHPIVNCSTAAIITILYTFLCGFLCVSGSRSPKAIERSRIHRRVFIQSGVVCCSSCAATYIYIYMQFFPVPKWLIIWASIGYQTCSALPCYVYLTLNTDIRRKATQIWRTSMGEVVSKRIRTSRRDVERSPNYEEEASALQKKESLRTVIYTSDDDCCDDDEIFL